jgi:hypothetical protein
MATIHLVVLREGRAYGVYRQPASDGTGQELIEGGFFSKDAAENSRDWWRTQFRDCAGCQASVHDHVQYPGSGRIWCPGQPVPVPGKPTGGRSVFVPGPPAERRRLVTKEAQ